MSRPAGFFLLALLAAPVLTYLIYRLAKGLGYLDPPRSKEHEYRRAVSAALYAFLLLLPLFLFGYQQRWPRVWAVFGVVNGIVLLFFGATGVWAAVRLWRIRHPEDPPALFRREDLHGTGSPLLDFEIGEGPPENPS